MSDTDQDLIEAIRAGNPRRFSVLVDRHKDRAMTLALRIVGERGAAEELVQDAFLRAYRGLEKFRGDAKFSTWFYRILYNVCMTRVLRRPKEKVEWSDDDMRTLDVADQDVPSAQERMEAEEMQALLKEELARIPQAFRSALTLFYVQELSYEEMASVLEMPLGTVKTNLSRGRVLLRKRVMERLNEEVHAA